MEKFNLSLYPKNIYQSLCRHMEQANLQERLSYQHMAIRMRIKNAVSLRIFNVYGRNQTSRYAGVVTRFASRLGKGMPPIIYGDGDQTRDFISVEDVVNSILAASKL